MSTDADHRNIGGPKEMEHCQNPWKNKCSSEDIKLYIIMKGEKLPICTQCWSSIADKDIGWGD